MTKKEKKDRHPWRENIEALTMAIAVALLFKVFVLEISRIPSGSMQPTLMGSPEADVFDRIVVDKLSYQFRDPERWDIVVFKHPLERSRIMVKRVVGLPGEELRVAGGDVYVRADPSAEWRVLRRPDRVQASMWKALETEEVSQSSWGAVEDAADWRFRGRSIKAAGSGRARFRARERAILNGYTDGYPEEVRGDVRGHPGEVEVGDLRLDCQVVAKAGTERVTVELSEGDRSYLFHLPGPAAPAEERPVIEVRVRGAADALASERAEDAPRLVAGEATSLRVENLDDRLRLLVDGDELLALDIDPVEPGGSGVTLAVDGSGAELEDLMVYRDQCYVADPGSQRGVWSVTIPAEHYVMLGDNTLDSADSRDWKSRTYTWSAETEKRTERGNFRDERTTPQANPVTVSFGDENGMVFRDRWGDRHWIRNSELAANFDAPEPEPLVPRGLIQGRALCVFWPISPTRGLWRLGWLH